MRLEAADELQEAGTEAAHGHPRSGLEAEPCCSGVLGRLFLLLLPGEKLEFPFLPAGVKPGSGCLTQRCVWSGEEGAHVGCPDLAVASPWHIPSTASS